MPEKTPPLVSIITPVYNTQGYLDRCISSILNQTYSKIELILINDGSTDNSGNICKKWQKLDSRILYIDSNNKGAGAARNKGLIIAHGEYIGFVDSDDWIESDYVKHLLELSIDNNADLVIFGYRRINNENEEITSKKEIITMYNKDEALRSVIFREKGESANYYIGNKFVKKSVLENFSFIEGTKYEDVDASYKFISNSNKVIVTNIILYNYFYNSSSVTYSPVTIKDLEYINVWKRIKRDIILNNKNKYLELCNNNLLRAHFTILCKMKMYGYDKFNSDMVVLYNSLINTIKKNFRTLIKIQMPITRKIVLIYLCLISH